MATSCIQLIGKDRYKFGSIGACMYSVLEDMVSDDEQTRRSGEEQFSEFLRDLGTFDPEKSIQTCVTQADREAAIIDAKKFLLESLGNTVDSFERDGYNIDTETIKSRLNEAVNGTDESQFLSDGSNRFVETGEQYLKFAGEKLDSFLGAVFGSVSGSLKARILERFSRKIVRALIYNDLAADPSEAVMAGTIDVNDAIWLMREKMFMNMVTYLKRNFPENEDVKKLGYSLFGFDPETDLESMGVRGAMDMIGKAGRGRQFDSANMNSAKKLFERLVINSPDFYDNFVHDNMESTHEQRRVSNVADYKKIMDVLKSIDDFIIARSIYDLDTGEIDTALLERYCNTPYEGNKPTSYLMDVIDFVTWSGIGEKLSETLGFDVVRRLREIIDGTDTELEKAVSDYVGLVRFDDMLESTQGRYISVDSRSKGSMFYSNLKYKRNIGGTNGTESYDSSEKDDLQNYTTDELKAILGLFNVVDRLNPSVSWNRSIEAKDIVSSFNKIKDGIVSGRYLIEFNDNRDSEGNIVKGNSSSANRNYFIDRLSRFGEDPIDGMVWFFDQMFGNPEIRFATSRPLIDSLHYKQGLSSNEKLTPLDLNVLYSFHKNVTTRDGRSLLSSVMAMNRSNQYGYSANGTRLLGLLARYLSSGKRGRYLVDETRYDGTVDIYVRPGYVSNYDVKALRTKINSFSNSIPTETRKQLAEKYNFTTSNFKHKNGDNAIRYSIRLSDGTALDITSTSIFGVMYGDENAGEGRIDMTPEGGADMAKYWSDLDAVTGNDIQNLKTLIVNNESAFSADMITDDNVRTLYSTLELLDDFLGLGFTTNPRTMLDVLGAYKNNYKGVYGLKNYMMPYVKMAFRAAYANGKYIEAADGNQTLYDYLKSSNDNLMLAYYNSRTRKGDQMRVGLSMLCNSCTYDINTIGDKAAAQLVDAEGQVKGFNNRSTFVGFDGDAMPFGRTDNQASNVHSTLERITVGSTGASRLDFVRYVLNDSVIGYEVKTRAGSKTFKSLRPNEMLYDAIINRFYNNMANDGTIIVMPTSYADAGTVPLYEIDLSRIGALDSITKQILRVSKTLNGKIDGPDDIIRKMSEVFGAYYGDLFNQSQGKLRKVLGQWVEDNEGVEKTVEVRELLDAYDADKIGNEDSLYNALALLSEAELSDAAVASGENMIRDYDYKKNRDGTLVANELLRGFRRIYGNKESLTQAMNRFRTNFLLDLLEEKVSFHVIDSWDKYEYHTGTRRIYGNDSNNSVYSAVNYFTQYCKDFLGYSMSGPEYRSDNQQVVDVKYFSDWVDRTSGRLILAKQKAQGPDGKEVTVNILDSLEFDSSKEFTLNPMLDFYNMVDTYMSRALNVFVSGNELGDKIKSNSIFTNAMRDGIADIVDFYSMSQEDAKYVVGKNSTFRCVDDLGRFVERLESGMETMPDGGEVSDEVKDYYTSLYDDCVFRSVNMAETAHNKRAKGAPSSRNTALANTLQGVTRDINVAVYDNVLAEGYSFSGERKKVDVMEGSVIMTYNQWRSETYSNMDNGEGTQSKPMLYNIRDDGTPDYVKYAGIALTNQWIRSNDHPESGIGMRDLFKKMTNNAWDSINGVSPYFRITRNYLRHNAEEYLDENYNNHYEADDARYVKDVLFGKEPLYYLNAYGVMRRIETLGCEEFGSTTGAHAYYTVEGYGTSDVSPRTARVYHLFYDDPQTGEKSLHKVFSNAEDYRSEHRRLQAAKMNPHTINSNYELHTALGGLWCVDADGKFSEANNDVVYNASCWSVVRNRKSYGEGAAPLTQTYYIQPLKNSEIHYLAPESTMKEGAGNINPNVRLLSSNREPLAYRSISTRGLGKQQGTGKSVGEDVSMRLPSQMIGALANNGVASDVVEHLYTIMQKRMKFYTDKIVEVVKRLDEESHEDKRTKEDLEDELYTALGEVFINNYKQYNYEEIVDNIMTDVRREFTKSDKHGRDMTGIPFSDKSFYERLSGVLSNYFTNAIRIKLRGVSNVLAPSYDMVMVYDAVVDKGTPAERKITLFSDDVVRRANAEYRDELVRFINSHEPGTATEGTDLIKLEDKAFNIDPTGKFSEYLSLESDEYAVMNHRKDVWLARHAGDDFTTKDREYFVPGEVVDILDGNKVVGTVTLNMEDNYVSFLEGKLDPPKARGLERSYRLNTTRARNLKPYIMRWMYADSKGVRHWMNYYALPHMREAMTGAVDHSSEEFHARCRQVIDDLYNHRFKRTKSAKEYTTVVGEIETEHAENVISNQYSELLGIRNGDTFADVMEEGKDYFYRAATNRLRAPSDSSYDIAFLKDDGRHALIRFGDMREDRTAEERPWDRTFTRGDNIWANDGDRDTFMVGRWTDIKDRYPSLVIHDNMIINDETGKQEVSDRFRIGTDKDGNRVIQERIDLVKRYVTNTSVLKSGRKKVTHGYDVYVFAPEKTFRTAFYGTEWSSSMIETIASSIYNEGGYALAQMAGFNNMSNRVNLVRRTLQKINNDHTPTGYENALHQYQVDFITGERACSWDGFERLKNEWYSSLANERWSSFQDSVKTVSARIPTSGMQSFMPMKTVGWTGTDSNTAFVSHFQIYMQGSDYDVDKANMLGQNYDNNGKYIGWSPFFDYSSLRTLEASKTLPVPLDITITESGDGVDITDELRTMLHSSETVKSRTPLLSVEGKGEEDRVRFLEAFSKALYKVNAADGKYKFDTERIILDERGREAVKQTFIKHSKHKISPSRYSDAMDNAITANVWRVSTDIRNLLSATEPTSTEEFEEAADRSPKGENRRTDNNLNSAKKYLAESAAQSAKEIVGIAANINKVFDYVYQWTTWALKSGDPELINRTRFSARITGVEGRSNGEIREKVVNHLPDLNTSDRDIADALVKYYRISDITKIGHPGAKIALGKMIDTATDNVKLDDVLSKINCVPLLAPVYGALLSLGFSIGDTVAFMTTPLVDNIVRFSSTDIFAKYDTSKKLKQAIDDATGRLNPTKFMHGYASSIEYTDSYGRPLDKISGLLYNFKETLDSDTKHPDVVMDMRRRLGMRGDESFATKKVKLQDLMQAFSFATARRADGRYENSLMLFSDFYGGRTQDYETNLYIENVDAGIKSLRKMALEYTESSASSIEETLAKRCVDGVNMIMSDLRTIDTTRRIADSMTTLAVGYLSLNKQMTYGDVELVKRLGNMNRVIGDIESDLQINAKKLFTKGLVNTVEMDALIDRIIEQSPHLRGNTLEEAAANRKMIGDRVKEAYDEGVLNNFDIRRVMADEKYRQVATRYLDVIKPFVNTLDLVYRTPNYRTPMDMLYAMDRALSCVSVRKRMLDEFIFKKGGNADENTLKQFDLWTDRVVMLDYFKNGNNRIITMKSPKTGYDSVWDETPVLEFDMSTDYGQAGFGRFMTGEFLNNIKNDPSLKGNAFVSALETGTRDMRTVLTSFVDMLDTRVTDSARSTFNDMVIGLNGLFDTKYVDNGIETDYTIGELLFLYNLAEYSNAPERTSLTTAFKGTGTRNRVVNDYYSYIDRIGRDTSYTPDYDIEDFYEFAAPEVREGSENWHNERAIKVTNDFGDYRLKKKSDNGSYQTTSFNQRITDSSNDNIVFNKRMFEYLTRAMSRMPREFNRMYTRNLILQATPERADSERLFGELKRMVVNYSMSDKVRYYVIC